MSKETNETLAWEAIHLALAHIQKKLGVTSGDVASHFFNQNGNELEIPVAMLAEYIAFERSVRKHGR